MALFPEMPSQLREFFPNFFWNWWQSFKSFMLNGLETNNDFTIGKIGKGIILKNAAGTITKRIRLNDLGDGIIIEDV